MLTNFATTHRGQELSPSYERRIATGWNQAGQQLKDLNAIVIGDVPTSPVDPPRCLARRARDATACDFSPSQANRGVR